MFALAYLWVLLHYLFDYGNEKIRLVSAYINGHEYLSFKLTFEVTIFVKKVLKIKLVELDFDLRRLLV